MANLIRSLLVASPDRNICVGSHDNTQQLEMAVGCILRDNEEWKLAGWNRRPRCWTFQQSILGSAGQGIVQACY